MDGTPFGRYRLIELLGRGGMGEVWRAFDTETDRIVAVKLLPPHLSENDEFHRRFRREAHAAARLNNPHVIPIHNYGEIDGQLYVDMRLIEGRDLHAVLADGPLDPSRVVLIIEQVANALHAAHQIGLLHRDVKPSNILLDGDDFAYLIDFGIARSLDETRMTKSSNTIGTLQYIAPERLGAGTEEDARADIYSLACVLYECLTGSPPFAADSIGQVLAAHLNTPPPQPSKTQPNLPSQLDEVVARGMAKEPRQRYATTLELAQAARDAITEPIARPTPDPTPTEPALARGHDTAPDPSPNASDSTATRLDAESLATVAQFGTPAASDQSTLSAAALPDATAGPGAGPPPVNGPLQSPSRSATTTTPRGPGKQVSSRRFIIVAGTALAVVVATGVAVIFATESPGPTKTPASTRTPEPVAPSQAAAPGQVVPNQAAPGPARTGGLYSVLLGAPQVGTIMGTPAMEIADQTQQTRPDLNLSDLDCLGAFDALQNTVYAGSGLTGVRGQELDTSDTAYRIYEGAVSFPTPDAARAFVAAQADKWRSCNGLAVTLTVSAGEIGHWTFGNLTGAAPKIELLRTRNDGRSTCQRVLSAVSDIVLDVRACAPDIEGQGGQIADRMAANIKQ